MSEGALGTQELVKKFASDIYYHVYSIKERLQERETKRLIASMEKGEAFEKDQTVQGVVYELHALLELLERVEYRGVANHREHPACLLCTEKKEASP